MRILAVVEATNVNAVAKNMFEFHRAANELAHQSAGFPVIELSLVTATTQRSLLQPHAS
jgi:hypothetical protein